MSRLSVGFARGLVGACALLGAAAVFDQTPFQQALERGSAALTAQKLDVARAELVRALERDPKSPEAWLLRARIAAAAGDADDQLFALHRRFALRTAQRAKKAEVEELRKEVEALDPIAPDLFDLKSAYVARLVPLAEGYEKERRPHSAIRVHQQILALDPDLEASRAAIERISSAPDPSLAETAKAPDLFAGVSDEWIRKFDAEHATWETHGVLERPNYVTRTDAGYAVMIRAAEAMEQMNGFYREFFRYGTEQDGKSVPRIDLRIFRTRDEYLKFGSGPPVEWSGGQFTGSAVETYVGQGGFEEMTTTLFHEAAHQFVGLATTAVGWLNEGLASFFEGSRILANGTVLMNMPANHRLFPLADRMAAGWMSGPDDGVDPANSSSEPTTAPTFRIVLENKYQWGPPWYAPTWGVVYFLWNYQDPIDGRFVYRGAFREFIDKSGGRSGEGAVENFEKVVLERPQPPTKGVDVGAGEDAIELPRTVADLDEVWKAWILALRDEQSGKSAPDRPWLEWARHALTRKDLDVAKEHFEKGIVAEPDDPDLLVDFAKFLAAKEKGAKAGRGTDRAAKLVLRALQALEAAEKVDEKRVKEVDQLLATLDPKRRTLDRILAQLEASAKGIAERYLASDRPSMAMDVSWRLGTDLGFPALFDIFERAARESGKSLALWRLAYNESDFDGWVDGGSQAFRPAGAEITSNFGDITANKNDYDFLICDTVTSGDFSLEAELLAENNVLAFGGLVFGKKSTSTFHTLVYYPGRAADARYNIDGRQASIDLTSFYGAGDFRVWRHNVLPGTQSGWHRLRVDVVGTFVDVWCDGQLVVTQEFPSLDVLRGSFGLLTGPGQARWRNIRYLLRHPRDPGARIERELVMQKEKEKAAAKGEPIGASYVGLVPPFPTAVKWVEQPRASFEEAGPAPQLLVFLGIHQNDKLPIDGWIKEFVAKWQEIGLKTIVIAGPDDTTFAAYAKQRGIPGSLAYDTRPRGRKSYGTTFETYFIERFNLPRALLIDIDQRVAWEGDPGFNFAEPWSPGAESMLDTPMEELVAKRKLREIGPWLEQWKSYGEAAWRSGDLAAALPLLQQAEKMAGALDPAVVEVRQQLAILKSAVTGLEGTAQQLERLDGLPALPTLLAWADLLGQPVPEELKSALAPKLNHPTLKALAALWKRAKSLVKPVQGKEGVAAAKPLVEPLRQAPAPFGPLAAERLEALITAGDSAKLAAFLDHAELVSAGQWLAESFFRW